MHLCSQTPITYVLKMYIATTYVQLEQIKLARRPWSQLEAWSCIHMSAVQDKNDMNEQGDQIGRIGPPFPRKKVMY
jgi:hypothetical protein